MTLTLHAGDAAGQITYSSLCWKPPCSQLAWPSTACDLKSLLSLSGGRPDSLRAASQKTSARAAKSQLCGQQLLAVLLSPRLPHCWGQLWSRLGVRRLGGLSCVIGLLGTLQLAGEATSPCTQILLQVTMQSGATSSTGQRGAPLLPACIFLNTPDFCPVTRG